MEFEIIPRVKCGELDFLSPREIVRALLGKYEIFRKSEFSENTTDDFGFCHTYYDKYNQLVAIEFFPEVSLNFQGKDLFLLSSKELASLLKSYDEKISMDEYFLVSKDLGISGEFDGDEVKSILVSIAGNLKRG